MYVRIGTLSNAFYPITKVTVSILRKEAKKYGVRIRTYGRFTSKKATFAVTGRRHFAHDSNKNSVYSINAPEAPYAYGWAIYRTTVPGDTWENPVKIESLHKIVDGHNEFLKHTGLVK